MRWQRQTGAVRGPFEITLLGLILLVTGIWRLFRLPHLSWTQVGSILLAIVACFFLLLIFDYTLHHARIASLIVLFIMLFWVVMSPSFCLGAGLAILIMIWTKWP